MEGISVVEIHKILDAIEDDEILYCHIRSSNFEVVLSSDGEGLNPASNVAPVQAQPTTVSAPAPAPTPAPISSSPTLTASPSTPIDPNAVPIVAPMIGTFYRASDPAAGPYVEVGSKITADSTIGLIEAMKVFCAIPAGIVGTVLAIEAENSSFVEHGAVLMWVLLD